MKSQIKSNWKQLKNDVKDQWSWFTHDQLDLIDGKQNYFIGKPYKNSYVQDKVEAEKRLSEWQQLQRDKLRNQDKTMLG